MQPGELSRHALVGSSNLTQAGLTQNLELNLHTTDALHVQALQEWYDDIWGQAEPIREDLLRLLEPHLRAYSPFEVYARALYEYFQGRELSDTEWEGNESVMFPELSRYQRDGYRQARAIAERREGALICDGVGLGKTFIGLMLLEHYIHRGERVLLIVPKSARKSVWERHIDERLRPRYRLAVRDFLTVHSMTDFGREGTVSEDQIALYRDYYDAIIVDEAHHFRNPGRNRSKALANLVGGRQKRLYLPNQPWGVFILETQAPRVHVTSLRRLLRALVPSRRQSPTRTTWDLPNLLFVCTPDYQEFTFAHFSGDKPHTAKLTTFGWSPEEPCRTLCEFNLPALRWPDDPQNAEAWSAQWATAFDVEKVTRRFFEQYRELFEWTRDQVKGLPNQAVRHEFTQALFNRLLFITFVQKKRWLDGNPRYLFDRFEQVDAEGRDFYRDFLYWLFFWALPASPETRTVEGTGGQVTAWTRKLLGDVPSLNGGLFEPGVWDDRDRVTIANDVFRRIFGEGLRIDKRLYGVTPRNLTDGTVVGATLLSTFGLLSREVRGTANFGQGLLELTVEESRTLDVLSPQALTPESRARLGQAGAALLDRPILMLYDDVRRPERRALDDAFLQGIGFQDGPTRAAVLHELQDAACRMIWGRMAKSGNARESRITYDEWLATGEPFGAEAEEDRDT